jgi:regulator of replication initiation timing
MWHRENVVWKWTKRVLSAIFILLILWFMLYTYTMLDVMGNYIKSIGDYVKSQKSVTSQIGELEKNVATLQDENSKLQVQLDDQKEVVSNISKPVMPAKEETVGATEDIPEIKEKIPLKTKIMAGLTTAGVICSKVFSMWRYVPVP